MFCFVGKSAYFTEMWGPTDGGRTWENYVITISDRNDAIIGIVYVEIRFNFLMSVIRLNNSLNCDNLVSR